LIIVGFVVLVLVLAFGLRHEESYPVYLPTTQGGAVHFVSSTVTKTSVGLQTPEFGIAVIELLLLLGGILLFKLKLSS
jgi:hypothetical protein